MSITDKLDQNDKLNIVIGDYFIKSMGLPSRVVLSNLLFMDFPNEKKSRIRDRNSFFQVAQSFLDFGLGGRGSLLKKVSQYYKCGSNKIANYQKFLFSKHVESLISFDYDTIVEDFYGEYIYKVPFEKFNLETVEKDNVKVSLFKCFGDISHEAEMLVTNQDFRKFTLLNHYRPYIQALADQFSTRKTLLLGCELDNVDFIEFMTYILKISEKNGIQPLYFIGADKPESEAANEFLERYKIEILEDDIAMFKEKKNSAMEKNIKDDPSLKIFSGTAEQLGDSVKMAVEIEETISIVEEEILITSDSYENTLELAEEITEEISEEIIQEILSEERVQDTFEEIEEEKAESFQEESLQEESEKNQAEEKREEISSEIEEENAEEISTSRFEAENIDEIPGERIVILDSTLKDRFVLETAPELKFSSLQLEKNPIKFSNIPESFMEQIIAKIDAPSLRVGDEQIFGTKLKLTSAGVLKFLEIKTREFRVKFAIVISPEGKVLEDRDYLEYEIFSSINPNRVRNIMELFIGIFSGVPLSFNTPKYSGEIHLQNRLQMLKFQIIRESEVNYQIVSEAIPLAEEKKFYSSSLTYYLNYLLWNSLRESRIESWGNIAVDSDIALGNCEELVILREHELLLKNGKKMVVEKITVEGVKDSFELRGDRQYLTQKRVVIETEIKDI